MKRAGTIVLRVISALLAVVMVGPGVQKFTSPMWERMFRTWGYPDGFHPVIGAIEVLGARVGLPWRLRGRLARRHALTLSRSYRAKVEAALGREI
jgi:hypothetical protein